MNLLLIAGFIPQEMSTEFLCRGIPLQIHMQLKFTDNSRSALLRKNLILFSITETPEMNVEFFIDLVGIN